MFFFNECVMISLAVFDHLIFWLQIQWGLKPATRGYKLLGTFLVFGFLRLQQFLLDILDLYLHWNPYVLWPWSFGRKSRCPLFGKTLKFSPRFIELLNKSLFPFKALRVGIPLMLLKSLVVFPDRTNYLQ